MGQTRASFRGRALRVRNQLPGRRRQTLRRIMDGNAPIPPIHRPPNWPHPPIHDTRQCLPHDTRNRPTLWEQTPVSVQGPVNNQGSEYTSASEQETGGAVACTGLKELPG